GELQVLGRDILVVICAIGAGRAVDVGAYLLERHEVLAVVVLGALEHQVLEEMGEPGAVDGLVLRADVVPNVDRGHGDGMILVEDDVQAVAEGVLLELDLDVGTHESSAPSLFETDYSTW